MKKGKELYDLILTRTGCPYVFGILVPKNDPNWKKGFDCAEMASWSVFQLSGTLYGTDVHDPAKAAKADAFTGFWADDAKKLGKIISVEEGIRTPGAFLLRVGVNGKIGHIVCSGGDGTSAEANSTKYGCGKFKTENRRFDFGILVPGFDYSAVNTTINLSGQKPTGIVYRYTTPLMPKSDRVKEIQEALVKAGFSVGKSGPDGWYGKDTAVAVAAFQEAKGLSPDGEVYTDTFKALEI